jgi:DinB family
VSRESTLSLAHGFRFPAFGLRATVSRERRAESRHSLWHAASGSRLRLPTRLAFRLPAAEAERKDFLSSLGDADFDRIVDCASIKGEKWRQPLENLLLHLAEHSSDHRGQLATLLRQVGAKPPEVDLLVYLEEKR